MTEKELRQLNRKELLELFINQTKELDALRETVRNQESELNDRKITIEESGSLAEASLRLNGLFADADKAAKEYIEHARLTEEKSIQALEEAHRTSDNMITEAENFRTALLREASRFVKTVNRTVQDYMNRHPETRNAFDEEKQED